MKYNERERERGYLIPTDFRPDDEIGDWRTLQQ